MQSKMTIKQQVQAACSKGQHEKEFRILDYNLKQTQRHYMAYYALACHHYKHKSIVDAEKFLIKSFKLLPNISQIHPYLYFLAAEICLDKEDLEEALKLANLASSMNMDRPILEHHLRGNIYAKMGRYFEAIAEFKSALVFCSEDVAIKESFVKKINIYSNYLINSLDAINDKEVALTKALSCITIPSPEVQQRCYLFLINTAASLSKLDFAYKHCLNACQIFPQNKQFEKCLFQILQQRAQQELQIEK